MKFSELIFVPAPAIGHLVSMAEMAKLLITRHKNLSITVLVAKLPIDTGVDQYTESLLLNAPARITIVILPETDPLTYLTKPTHTILTALIESQKSNVRDIMSSITRSDSTRLVGVVADLLCTNIMEVANEFSVPTYVYSPAGAGFLGVVFHLQTLRDDDKLEWNELKNSDTELVVPSFSNSVPAQMLPLMFLDKEGGSDLLLSMVKMYREAKGIIVNTFEELESYAVASLRSDSMLPPIYPVGPMLNLNGDGQNADETETMILGWLDDQPPSSVVFLCFGSFGSFQDNQVKEIAVALERSGHRFLWSLRPSMSMTEGDTKLHLRYQNLEEILPTGFLERTASVGKVIGWAPQVAVLSHDAVGGFVSHCGWNSTMESVWFGVPIATWPIYAEQQLNAFELVKELGLAVEIEVDYRNEFNKSSDVVIGADEIETKIRKLMMDGEDNEIRNTAKEIKEKSRAAVAENGSSYTSLAKLIEDII